MVTPGVSIGTSRKLIPACFFTVLSVRARMKIQLASIPRVHQVFWPLITHSSPSSTASQRTAARSDPAPGSL